VTVRFFFGGGSRQARKLKISTFQTGASNSIFEINQYGLTLIPPTVFFKDLLL
jgi:hypothetical protein